MVHRPIYGLMNEISHWLLTPIGHFMVEKILPALIVGFVVKMLGRFSDKLLKPGAKRAWFWLINVVDAPAKVGKNIVQLDADTPSLLGFLIGLLVVDCTMFLFLSSWLFANWILSAMVHLASAWLMLLTCALYFFGFLIVQVLRCMTTVFEERLRIHLATRKAADSDQSSKQLAGPKIKSPPVGGAKSLWILRAVAIGTSATVSVTRSTGSGCVPRRSCPKTTPAPR